MLQGTYFHDDEVDFGPSSRAIDAFEACLASGQPVRSAHLKKRCSDLGSSSIMRLGSVKRVQQPETQKALQPKFLAQPLTQRRSIACTFRRSCEGQMLSEEEEERLEEIEAVRRLGNDEGDDDD
ncbi:hypothetical protein ERJ75_001190100 [Trypanosoma vivax]|nr:hypothetical protein ERJ75_001190100 [Trypanosoma vivax]